MVHRWYRWRLRTLLFLVTGVCLGLSWEIAVIRQRTSAWKAAEASGKFLVTTVDEHRAAYASAPPGPVASIRWSRRLLGDEPVQQIWYRTWGDGASPEEIQRLAHIFPEAELLEMHAEPCHPGCFPRGTLVETPNGAFPIEDLPVGAEVLAIDADGSAVPVAIKSVFITHNYLWRISTELGDLTTTETQPLCTADHAIRSPGQLRPGERVLAYSGSKPVPTIVTAVQRTGQSARVFNLVLGNSEVFVAGGYLVRSKPPASSLELRHGEPAHSAGRAALTSADRTTPPPPDPPRPRAGSRW